MVRAALVWKLPDLIKHAVLFDDHPDNKQREHIARTWRFAVPVMLDGRLRRVILTVREYTDGKRRHRAMEHAEIEVSGEGLRPHVTAAADTLPTPDTSEPGGPGAPAGAVVTIRDLLRGVNRSDGKPVISEETAGSPAPGVEAYSATTASASFFEVAAEAAQAVAARVRSALTSKTPLAVVHLGKAPPALRTAGLPNKPITTSSSILHKSMSPQHNDHAVNSIVLENLPALLANPRAVFRSLDRNRPDRFVVMVDTGDAKGRPVIVAIDPAGDRNVLNFMVSAYGADDHQDWIEKHVKAGRLLYARKGNGPRVQVPGPGTDPGWIAAALGAARNKVLSESDVIKRFGQTTDSDDVSTSIAPADNEAADARAAPTPVAAGQPAPNVAAPGVAEAVTRMIATITGGGVRVSFEERIMRSGQGLKRSGAATAGRQEVAGTYRTCSGAHSSTRAIRVGRAVDPGPGAGM